MKPAPQPTCRRHPLQPQKVVKKTLAQLLSLLSGVVLTSFFFWGLLIAALGASTAAGLLLLGTGIAGLAIYAYEHIYFGRYYYHLDEEHLVIRKGVFTYGETTLPYARIQDVFVDQDVLDQTFGLYDLHVSTATLQSAANAHIDGLSFSGAEAIKAEILERMKRARRERD